MEDLDTVTDQEPTTIDLAKMAKQALADITRGAHTIQEKMGETQFVVVASEYVDRVMEAELGRPWPPAGWFLVIAVGAQAGQLSVHGIEAWRAMCLERKWKDPTLQGARVPMAVPGGAGLPVEGIPVPQVPPDQDDKEGVDMVLGEPMPGPMRKGDMVTAKGAQWWSASDGQIYCTAVIGYVAKVNMGEGGKVVAAAVDWLKTDGTHLRKLTSGDKLVIIGRSNIELPPKQPVIDHNGKPTTHPLKDGRGLTLVPIPDSEL